jgi:hypothetical protein
VKAELRRFGESQSPVVVIDDFSGSPERIAELADALAPFEKAFNFYPGLRRVLTPEDSGASAYVEQACQASAQFVAGAFDVSGFSLLEASFSMVTTQPTELRLPQRAPHFDSVNPDYIALLHYLRVPKGTGTSFFRQRSTNIELVTAENVDLFVETAKRETGRLPANVGYIHGSNQFFEEIGSVEAVPDRMIMYQGSLLHSGIIPPHMPLSSDPREGRLTANFFILAQREQNHA